MKNKRQRMLAIFALVIALCATSIAFAALQTTLNISGTVTKKGGSWDIHFENIDNVNIVGGATMTTPTLNGTTTVNFSATLTKPNDEASFTVDVKNSGTIDAVLSSVTLTGVDTAKEQDITYSAVYSDNSPITTNETLAVNGKKTIKITVKYDDVSSISSTDVTLNLGLTLLYIQDNSSSSSDGGTGNLPGVTKKYDDGEVVYFNVTTGNKCTASDYTESQSATGVKSGCMKFYAFNDSEDSLTVDLLLDHNTNSTVAWNNNRTKDGPFTALISLKADTDNWVGIEAPTTYTDEMGYTLLYDGYKARLISAQEIARITQNYSWKAGDEIYYLDSNTSEASTTCQKDGDISGCQFGWLYDRTSNYCNGAGCLNNSDYANSRYWTSTEDSSKVEFGPWAYTVDSSGKIGTCPAYNNTTRGIRPVIKVLKTKLTDSSTDDTSSEPTGDHLYQDGEVVLYNVSTGQKCANHTEEQSKTGIKSGCMKFYAFNDSASNDKVSLILDHNTTATVMWNSNNSNKSGPNEVYTQLKNDTSNWKGIERPTIYVDPTGYTLSYDGYNSRLITAQEIAQITGNQIWKTDSEFFYLDTNTKSYSATCIEGNTSGCKYGWLYDRISTECTRTCGCLNNSDKMTFGYWTSTSNKVYGNQAWIMTANHLFNATSLNTNTFGVRPVIEVLKSKLA